MRFLLVSGRVLVCCYYLVGGFNPSEKYSSNWESSPNFRGDNKKCLSCHHPAKVESKKITLNKSGWWFQPIFWGVKPSFFMALGSHGCCYHPFISGCFSTKTKTKTSKVASPMLKPASGKVTRALGDSRLVQYCMARIRGPKERRHILYKS